MSEAENLITAALAEGRTTLIEPEAKSLLSAVGVETPAFAVAGDTESAADAAADLGFPVVLKVSSPAVTHKSEWAEGAGVAVGLDSREEVQEAAERVFEAAEAAGIDADVLIEEPRNVEAGTEVIVGGLRDASFGPVVLTGLGGVFTEIYEDTAHRVAPIDRSQARAALDELTAARLLSSYRGREATDREALAAVLMTVGDLICEHETIAEVDVNPVLATAEGAVALDALVVLNGDATDTTDATNEAVSDGVTEEEGP